MRGGHARLTLNDFLFCIVSSALRGATNECLFIECLFIECLFIDLNARAERTSVIGSAECTCNDLLSNATLSVCCFVSPRFVMSHDNEIQVEIHRQYTDTKCSFLAVFLGAKISEVHGQSAPQWGTADAEMKDPPPWSEAQGYQSFPLF